MSLSIKLISTNLNQGVIIISNNSDTAITDWKIKIKPHNFNFMHMTNLDFYEKKDYCVIVPKEWKIHIEDNSKIVSEFTYTGSSNLNFDFLDHTFSKIESKKIQITVTNNSDKDIIIKSGEKHTFLI